MTPSFLCCILALSCLFVFINGAVETGTIKSENGFAFASKFCFQTGDPAGTTDITLTMPIFSVPGREQTGLVLLAYDDQDDTTERGSWPKVLENWDNWDCQTKVANAKLPPGEPLDWNGTKADSVVLNNADGTATLTWNTRLVSQHARPRFWFYAFALCESGFQDVSYNIHFQQDENSWNKEFGANEAGLNSLYLAFFLLFTIILAVNTYGTYQLQQKLSYLHPLVKLFLIILIIEYLGLFCLLLHYGSYSSNGEGILLLMKLGQVLVIISRCLFMLLLILLAKGWTISNETLTHKWAVITVVLSYLLLSVFILVWSYSMEDPKSTSPGKTEEALAILLNFIWLIFALWFSIQIFFFSYRKEDNPAKKSLFLKLGIAFSIWFFLPPLTSFAVFTLDPWARERIVAFFTVGITTLAYSVLVFLFWPSRAEEFFAIATPEVFMGAHSGRSDEDYATL